MFHSPALAAVPGRRLLLLGFPNCHRTIVAGPVRACATLLAELEQIQFLGHISVETTERYLGCKQRLHGAVNDHIGLEP
jgi:hypothetical protein